MLTSERLVICPDPQAASAYLSQRIADELNAAIALNGAANLIVAGGSSFALVYANLAKAVLEWPSVSLYFGDERCVLPEDPRSNFYQLNRSLLEALPADNRPAVYRMEGELEPPAAARRYGGQVKGRDFDIALLGIGPDGHTASLFPGRLPGPQDGEDVAVCLHPGLEPLVPRITLTPAAFRRVASIFCLAFGESKAEIVAQALRDYRGILPISLIEPDPELVVDQSAAGSL